MKVTSDEALVKVLRARADGGDLVSTFVLQQREQLAEMLDEFPEAKLAWEPTPGTNDEIHLEDASDEWTSYDASGTELTEVS